MHIPLDMIAAVPEGLAYKVQVKGISGTTVKSLIGVQGMVDKGNNYCLFHFVSS